MNDQSNTGGRARRRPLNDQSNTEGGRRWPANEATLFSTHMYTMSVFISHFQNSLPVTQNPYSLCTQRAIKARYTSGASKGAQVKLEWANSQIFGGFL